MSISIKIIGVIITVFVYIQFSCTLLSIDAIGHQNELDSETLIVDYCFQSIHFVVTIYYNSQEKLFIFEQMKSANKSKLLFMTSYN